MGGSKIHVRARLVRVHHTRNYYLDNDCGLSRCVVLSSKSLIGNYSLLSKVCPDKIFIILIIFEIIFCPQIKEGSQLSNTTFFQNDVGLGEL